MPPLTNLVLSRAKSRQDISSTLIELREEYKDSRLELWELLKEMWSSDKISDQLLILKELENSSKSLFKASYKDKLNMLSLGLDLAQFSMGGLVSASQKVLGYDKPNARVSSISFSKKLSNDYFSDLRNNRTILKKHLSNTELKDFGII